LPQAELFYKLVITNITSARINECRVTLQQELFNLAGDPTLLKRRFRMLSQLADYESQIYKKIHQFQSNDLNDYIVALRQITQELYHVIDRSG